MPLPVHLLALLLFVMAYGCSQPAPPDAPAGAPPIADVIYTNASIWTGVPGASRAEALAIRGDTLLAVGTAAQVARHAGPQTRVVDLEGRFVVPGFIDNHTHLLSGGFGLASVDLRSASTPADFTERLAAFAARTPTGRWITEQLGPRSLGRGPPPPALDRRRHGRPLRLRLPPRRAHGAG